jgi:hypothetical protein
MKYTYMVAPLEGHARKAQKVATDLKRSGDRLSV